MSVGVAYPGDRNVIQKDSEKILKYKDLIIEIQRVWNVTAKVIPVMIGATGTISKIAQAVPEQHTGEMHEIKQLQTPAILGKAHRYCGKC